VGDSIHRITLEATRSMPAEAAATEAMRLGREFVETQRSVFEEYQERCKFSVLPCSEVQTWPDCPAYYAALLDSFESQPEFRKSVENFSRIYHDRREEKLDPGEYEWRVNRSSHYFLEEFAIFCCLRQRGFRVMVYPGSFSTLAEVAEGGHPGVPAELSDITVVSLHLKGRRG
jgi:tRNA-dependent cyclodipeptide synthase